MTINDEKKALRISVGNSIAALPLAVRKRSDAALLSAFLALPELLEAKTIFLYYGVGQEVPTGSLLAPLFRMGKRICLPRCSAGGRMDACLFQEGDALQAGVFGIPTPTDQAEVMAKEDLDLILVPALCCDREGYRLGKGGGYYDRYLASYRGQSVALCRVGLLQHRLPREDFDQPVSFLVTEAARLVPKRIR